MINYPIRIIITVCLTIIIFAIVGCDRHNGASEKLNLAESLMDSKPDSALSILNAVNVETLNGKKDKARYALLKSMALDKNYIDTTSLDILQPAIDYYLRKGTADEKLRTYYYQGRIYQNRENNDSAMQSFMRGREDELKQLKSDLAILAPSHEVPDDRMRVNKEEQDREEFKRDEQTQLANRADVTSQSISSKDSMVAEPQYRYQSSPQTIRPAYRPNGL